MFGKVCAALVPVGKGKKPLEDEDEGGKKHRSGPAETGDLEDDFDLTDEGEAWSDVESEFGVEAEAKREATAGEEKRTETERMKLMRTRTLEKYSRILTEGQANVNESFVDRKHRELEREREENPNQQKTRRKRAQTMKRDFFDKMMKEGTRFSFDLSAMELDDQSDFAKSLTKRGSVLDGETAFNYPAMEDELEEMNLKQLKERYARTGEKLEEERQLVSEIAKDLLKEQDAAMKKARAESSILVPKMKKQIQKVSNELAKKLKENHSQEGLEGRPVKKESRWGRKHKKKEVSKRDLHKHLTDKGKEEQAKFEEQVVQLRKELALLHKHLSTLRTEERFPRGLQWKLKVDAGDGTFIGVRDLEVGKVLADFSIHTKDSNRIVLRVTNIQATVGMLDFSIRGANTKAKLLGGLLTPTINRLDLDVKGEWTLELRFMSGDRKRQQARWEEVKENSKFNLQISRKVTGLTTMRLPKSILQSLSKLLIPKLISGALRAVLPTQLGLVLSEQYNNIQITGKIDAKGDMSPAVWREPLVGPTELAAKAREALGITEDEAFMVDLMCRGERAAAAGFKPKAVSLARLFKWRLKYATYKVSDLAEMLDLVQNDSHVPLPNGWFTQLLKYVSLLAKKPLDFRAEISRIDADIDLMQAVEAGVDIYVGSFRAALNMARAEKAKAVALRQLEEAQTYATTVSNVMNQYVLPSISSTGHLMLNGMLVGGLETGLVALALRDTKLEAKLPPHFFFRGIVPANSKSLALDFEGKAGPRSDEYTLRISEGKKEGSERDEEDNPDSEISIRNTKIELFPSDAPQGTVRLDASEVRVALQLNTLDVMLQDLTDSVSSSQQESASPLRISQGTISAETAELLRASQEVVGMFRNYDVDVDDREASAKAREDVPTSRVLPGFLSKDSFDTRFDVKGLKATIRKVDSHKNGAQTLRVAIHPGADPADVGHQACGHLRIRLNMRDMFDEFL